MTAAEMQRAYLAGARVEDLAQRAGIGRGAAYKRLASLGTAMRSNGPPTPRLALAAEILEDLNTPMTLADLKDWLGAQEHAIVKALLVLLRQNAVALVRIEPRDKQTPEQGTLL